MKILAVDVGNSNVKIGLYDEPGDQLGSWIISSTDTPSKVAAALTDEIREPLKDVPSNELQIVASSVVPRVFPAIRKALAGVGRSTLVVGHKTKMPVKNGYCVPGQVGIDRLAGAVGAVSVAGAPVIFVDAGTALTVNVIDEASVFRGGAIMPGARLWARSLAQHTAALPLIAAKSKHMVFAETRALADTTKGAIQAGIIWGLAGAVDRLVQKMRSELGSKDVPVLLTGGGRDMLAMSKTIQHIVPDLTLRGLVEIARQR